MDFICNIYFNLVRCGRFGVLVYTFGGIHTREPPRCEAPRQPTIYTTLDEKVDDKLTLKV